MWKTLYFVCKFISQTSPISLLLSFRGVYFTQVFISNNGYYRLVKKKEGTSSRTMCYDSEQRFTNKPL